MTSFSEWIVSELERRGWSRSEAARRGDISASMMDKVINGVSQPGLSFIKGIAKAFNISLVEVLERAGEYQPKSPVEWQSDREEWESAYDVLSPEDRAEMLEFVRLKINRHKNKPHLKIDTSPLKPRPSDT